MAGTHSGQDTLPSPGTLTSTSTLRLGNVDMTIHLKYTSLGYGRKLMSLEETHSDMERMCKFHIDSGSGLGIQYFVFFISIIK